MEVARNLAVVHLPADQFADAKVQPFSQGGFHRLYSITSSNDPTAPKYLMRVALPVDPFFKTESEVATIQYIREHSSLPVPKVVAFSSSSANPLGFEWILMEKMDGVPLADVWQDMTFDAKTSLVVDFAEKIQPLLDLRFSLFGNIYFADISHQVGCSPLMVGKPEAGEDVTVAKFDVDIGGDRDYVIGRVVSMGFFYDKRLLLPAERGPFQTARELALAELRLLGRRIRNLSPDPKDDYYSETDTELASAGLELIEVFDKLEHFASTKIFPPPSPGSAYEAAACDIPPEDRKVLWHHDMSKMNVLVHPETYNFVGVVDWESVGVVPALSADWKFHAAVPPFLHSIEIDDENAPPPRETLTDEEEEGCRYIRDDWETQLLRRRYQELVSPPAVLDMDDEKIRLKRALSSRMNDFEGVWERTKYMLEYLLRDEKESDGGRDEEEEHDGEEESDEGGDEDGEEWEKDGEEEDGDKQAGGGKDGNDAGGDDRDGDHDGNNEEGKEDDIKDGGEEGRR